MVSPGLSIFFTLEVQKPPVCAAPFSRPLMAWPGPWALSLQSSTQEIGEELINGVIYSISLRKVQLHQGATKGQRWLGVSMDRRPEW